MRIVPPALAQLYSSGKAAANFNAVSVGLDTYGLQAGLDRPHRLAHYLAQIAHESGGFVYDKEIWGPTPAQAGYDTRADLGNTPAADGDGELYRGRSAIQVTGKKNYEAFQLWCSSNGLNPPDLVANPDLVDTDPWEGLAPIWFWTINVLNDLADKNDIEQITKRINGGLNGFADRLAQYTRIGLVLCGFAPDDVRGFQMAAKSRGVYTGGVDGDSGPQTRAAIHQWLASLTFAAVKAAPVVQTKPVAVAPKGADKTTLIRTAGAIGMAAPTVSAVIPRDDIAKLIFLAVGIIAVAVMLWRGEVIAARVKSVLKSFEG